ncbi:transglutaminase domain-containing protein [Leucobacter triazinivorans]|uniref:Transglutaminase-like domain-containing protein n=1 Tax=Leucobacter triazinivorans TaxID=1784719 RepID=A0A4P6KC22_9MICO|nr:transglutaminase domain-containing protein [Leucobacter triazinivorans]QBE47865.1 hypothetical protein EVS81_02675 [Leucobacter triazinivorans]
MSAVSLALAVGLVAALPPVPDRVWNSAAVSVSPVSSGMPDVTLALARDLRERSSTVAFEYRGSTDGDGSGNGTARFTLAVLSDFERGIWLPEDELDPGGASVVAQRPMASGAPASARPLGGESVVAVRVKGLLSSWLPMPSRAERIEAIGGSFDPEQWMWGDGTATARSDTALTRPGDRFRVLLADPPALDGSGNPVRVPSAEAPADPDRYLALPEDLPDAIADAARVATASLDPESSASPDADAYRTLSAASRLEGWFRSGEFVYDERAPYEPGADSDDPYAVMSAFLEQRTGYCVHFASTYAVMARSLGLPSRVAVGYVSRPSSPTGWTAVRARELHAWPEVHVDGVGWVAFEPTPGGAGYRAETGRPDPAESAAGDAPSMLEQLPLPETDADEPQSDPEQSEETEEVGADEPGGSRGSSGAPPGPGLVLGAVGLVVVLLGIAPAVRRARRGVRRRRVARGERPAAHAWAELVDTAVDLGVYAPEAARVRARTPEAIAEYLVSRGLRGDAAAAALGLARALVEERYAAAPAPAREAGPLRSELELATSALRSTAGWPARLRAALLPRSVLRR